MNRPLFGLSLSKTHPIPTENRYLNKSLSYLLLVCLCELSSRVCPDLLSNYNILSEWVMRSAKNSMWGNEGKAPFGRRPRG